MKRQRRGILRILRNLFRRREAELELDAEVRSYVRMVEEERIAKGMSGAEAHRTAMREFGGVEQVKQAVRDRRAGAGMEQLWMDMRYGARQLWRSPGFTATVLFTLALSIGANTAIFSIVNALMLTRLPYAHPERLGTIYTRITGPISEDERHHINGEQWELLRDRVPALISAISNGHATGVDMRAGSHVEYLHYSRVSAHYLDVLEIQPLMGRNFTKTEDLPNGAKVAILSYGLWQSTFESDPNIVGKPILLKGEPYTVVGVLPQGATTPIEADLYTTIQASQNGEGGGTNFTDITRLRDGATWQEADAEINRAWLARHSRYEPQGAAVSYYSVPLQKGETEAVRPQATGLMLAAGFILLIASANLAGLTLVRMMRRGPEMATRLALGASRWQVRRQIWVEHLMLALLGGAAGVLVGYGALRELIVLLPEHYLPTASVPLDGRVLLFTLAVSVVTSVLFGMLPALALRDFDLRSALASRGMHGGDRIGVRQALIAGEVALTVVLLAGSGLLIRSLVHLETLPPGFDATGVMTAKAPLDDVRYRDSAEFRKLMDEGTAAMRQIPGVKYAAVGLSVPYERALNDGITLSEGPNAGTQVMSGMVYVTPEYFQALQMRLLAGRYFTDSDGPDTEPVVIVNQTFARKFFHGENPIGRHIEKNMRIVGVVADVPIEPGLEVLAPLMSEESIYEPAAQQNAQGLTLVHTWFQPDWIVRTRGPVDGLTGQMQKALASVDPNLPFSGFYSMKDLQAKALATQRVEVALLSAMAGLALLLSAVGIFALVANVVAQKTREIGIRMALGSTLKRAMVHVGAPGVRASAAGLVLGLLLCSVALRAMRSVLYGVGVYDGPTIMATVAVLALVTVAAGAAPALRIAKIDPAATLREE
ncbi:ADOP family duplicated permease [Acidicapsa dinghuensis]|uniref:ADOP family duplicated permease n=1 Tax=Acidicapsa dinghuensis TaxID=2218256 RepID=A0ABW1EG75_9BACT|nr:ABC transporter permease [Acidicapsa dinghuensis]